MILVLKVISDVAPSNEIAVKSVEYKLFLKISVKILLFKKPWSRFSYILFDILDSVVTSF